MKTRNLLMAAVSLGAAWGGAAAPGSAHAYYTARELFSGLELVDPSPSWAEYLADDGWTGRFADIVRGAWAHYDWTDLVTATVIHTGDSY